MAGIYGVFGVADTERIFLNTLGQNVVYDAVNQYMAMHNAELAATLGIIIGETTSDFKRRYFLPGGRAFLPAHVALPAVKPGEVVEPDERLTWPRTAGIGAQHVIAMFGATFLVPILTGFDPSTTLFFTAMSTALFLLINNLIGLAAGIYALGALSDLLAPSHGDESLRMAILWGLGLYLVAGALMALAGRWPLRLGRPMGCL